MGKSAKVEVTEYRMAMHMGVSTGPVDYFTRIKIGDKIAWRGRVAGVNAVDLYDPNLFGGPSKEGGVDGLCWFLPGDPTQVLPTALANRLVSGATGADVPAFRRQATVFFVGAADKSDPAYTALTETDRTDDRIIVTGLLFGASRGPALNSFLGFAWGVNNPYLKPAEIQAERIPQVLSPTYASIPNTDDPDQTIYDANPAHIIYECFVDTDWGMGALPEFINTTSFNAAAQTLFNEGFGLSFEWDRQGPIKDFIQTVIDHIQGAVYLHPKTGLWTITLFRADYDIGSLPSFDESNSEIDSYSTKLIGETINQLTVKFTNFVDESKDTVTLQDLGNIIAQGDVVADTREYLGIQKASLAAFVCARDLRGLAMPLASTTVFIDRSAWDLTTGGVFKLSSVEQGITDKVFRAVDVNEGHVGSRKIQVAAIEDVFGLGFLAYGQSPPTLHVDTSEVPADMTYFNFMTAPAYFLPSLSNDTLADPETLVCVLASQTGGDTFHFELWAEDVADNGDVAFAFHATLSTVPRSLLTTALVAEVQTSAFVIPALTVGAPIDLSTFMIIGADEATQEIALLSAVVGTEWTLKRGMLDTTPKDWPIGTPVWFVHLDTPFADPSQRVAGETAKYKLLSTTSLGTLAESSATERDYTLIARTYRPIRPANISINGTQFGTYDGRGVPTITATWATRNKLLEDVTALAWTDGSITPESGQKTKIVLRKVDGTLIGTIDDISGESQVLDPETQFHGNTTVDVFFYAKLDDVDSLQAHKITVRADAFDSNSSTVETFGYGQGFGLDFGGT